MDRIRIGVIGLGWFGKFYCDAIGTPEDAMLALEATLAAEESARTGDLVRIG